MNSCQYKDRAFGRSRGKTDPLDDVSETSVLDGSIVLSEEPTNQETCNKAIKQPNKQKKQTN